MNSPAVESKGPSDRGRCGGKELSIAIGDDEEFALRLSGQKIDGKAWFDFLRLVEEFVPNTWNNFSRGVLSWCCMGLGGVGALSDQHNDVLESGTFLLLLLFALKGWRRFVHRSAHIRLAAENAKLYERLAMEDALTGLPNRGSFERTMAEQLGRPNLRVALLMIDVDHFKRSNDGFSHGVGDQVLQGIAGVLRRAVGDAGVAARLAGDEFVVGLFGLDHDHESRIIGGVEVAMATHNWERLAPGLRATVSLELARAGNGDTLAALFRRGDEHMYKYKRAARDVAAPLAT